MTPSEINVTLPAPTVPAGYRLVEPPQLRPWKAGEWRILLIQGVAVAANALRDAKENEVGWIIEPIPDAEPIPAAEVRKVTIYVYPGDIRRTNSDGMACASWWNRPDGDGTTSRYDMPIDFLVGPSATVELAAAVEARELREQNRLLDAGIRLAEAGVKNLEQQLADAEQRAEELFAKRDEARQQVERLEREKGEAEALLSTEREVSNASEKSRRNLAKYAADPSEENYQLGVSGLDIGIRDAVKRRTGVGKIIDHLGASLRERDARLADLEGVVRGFTPDIKTTAQILRNHGMVNTALAVEDLASRLTAAVEQQDSKSVIEMRLCESTILGLRPDVLYRFTVDPACARCVELASPFVEQAKAAPASIGPDDARAREVAEREGHELTGDRRKPVFHDYYINVEGEVVGDEVLRRGYGEWGGEDCYITRPKRPAQADAGQGSATQTILNEIADDLRDSRVTREDAAARLRLLASGKSVADAGQSPVEKAAVEYVRAHRATYKGGSSKHCSDSWNAMFAAVDALGGAEVAP